MRFIVIINEKAGTSMTGSEAESADSLRAIFAAEGIDADVQIVPPADIEARLRDALAARPDAIAIGGGDGTVRSAAAALADTGVTLGVLPLGTLNHFAKDLGMPLDLKNAIGALARGEVRDVDVGDVNGQTFINNCSLGTYAEAVRHRDALRKKHGHGKWFAMFWASLKAFRRFRRMRLEIVTDSGEPRRVRTPLVVVANNRYSGRALGNSLRPSLDEGRLWIYTALVHRHLAALRMVWQSLVHSLDAADALGSEPATAATIASRAGPLSVAMDGEAIDLQSPLRFRIRPGALRVLVPRPGVSAA